MTRYLAIARRHRIRLTVAVLALVLIAVLGLRLTRNPGHGLSQVDAVRIARAHANAGVTGLRSAEIRHDFNTGFGLHVHPWTWLVTFNGQWHLLCSGGCDPTTEWVAIDYYTGDWIASQYSYPAP